MRVISDTEEDLGCLALKVFSRFESALKNAAPQYAEQRGDSLNIKWRELVRTVESQFDPEALTPRVHYLVEQPPLKQAVDTRGLTWNPMSPAPAPVTLEWLLGAAYVVRNNLFHGGKKVPFLAEAQRDTRLVIGALEVIATVVALSTEIRNLYMEPVIEFAG